MNNQGQVSGQQGDGLGPAGTDVGHHQAVDEGTRQWTAAVGHQVDLQVARWGLVPVVVGPYRNPVSHGFRRPLRRRLPAVDRIGFSSRSRVDALAVSSLSLTRESSCR